MGEMLGELSRSGGVRHPLLQAREIAADGIVLMTADKGLAGAFNSNLVREGLGLARRATKPSLYLVGTKARVQLRSSGYPVEASWALQSKPFPELAREIAQRVSGDFLSAKIDKLTLVSSRFVSTIVQRPTPSQLLPIAPSNASDGASPAAEPEKPGQKNAFEFEPDAAAVLVALLPKYLEFAIFQALLETQASFFAAQLIAMTNATDNAGKLIDELTLVMNKTRQAAITKEILEIVGGAEALKG